MEREPPVPARWSIGVWQDRQVVMPGSGYWWDNRVRGDGGCVAQYTRRGQLRLRHRQQWHLAPAGWMALFRHGDDCEYGVPVEDPETYECSFVVIEGAGVAAHWQELIARHGPVIPYGPEVLEQLVALMALADPRQATPASRMAAAVHGFVLALYDRPRSASGGERPAVDQAIDAILANPTHPWSLKEVAGRHGISREHLARAFHRRVGEAPWAWITARRLERAQRLLTGTTLPMAEVARQCGYASPQVFARNLVAATGRGPRDWRRGG